MKTTQLELGQTVLFSTEPKPEKTGIILSGKETPCETKDIGKTQIIPDKIRVKDEPYESLFTVFNKEDASLFIKTYNQILKKIMGYEKPMTYRKYAQNNQYLFEIYAHRWCIKKDGKLEEISDKNFNQNKWNTAMKEINAKLGKVYRIKKEG